MRSVQGSDPPEDRPGGMDMTSRTWETEARVIELLKIHGPLAVADIRPLLPDDSDLLSAMARLRLNGRIRYVGYRKTSKIWRLA